MITLNRGRIFRNLKRTYQASSFCGEFENKRKRGGHRQEEGDLSLCLCLCLSLSLTHTHTHTHCNFYLQTLGLSWVLCSEASRAVGGSACFQKGTGSQAGLLWHGLGCVVPDCAQEDFTTGAQVTLRARLVKLQTVKQRKGLR